MAHIKPFRKGILRVYRQRKGSDLAAGIEAAIYRAANQQRAQPLPALICAGRKPPHTKTRNRIAWQFSPVTFGNLRKVDLRRTQGVVPENALRLCRVCQHIGGADALAPMLMSQALKIFIEFGYAACESATVVALWIEYAVVKHCVLLRGTAPAQS